MNMEEFKSEIKTQRGICFVVCLVLGIIGIVTFLFKENSAEAIIVFVVIMTIITGTSFLVFCLNKKDSIFHKRFKYSVGYISLLLGMILGGFVFDLYKAGENAGNCGIRAVFCVLPILWAFYDIVYDNGGT